MTLLDPQFVMDALGAGSLDELRALVERIAEERHGASVCDRVRAGVFVQSLVTDEPAPACLYGVARRRSDFANAALQVYLGYDPTSLKGDGFEPPVSLFTTTDDPTTLTYDVVLRAVELMCADEQRTVAAMISAILEHTREKAYRDELARAAKRDRAQERPSETFGKRKLKKFNFDLTRARRLADLLVAYERGADSCVT